MGEGQIQDARRQETGGRARQGSTVGWGHVNSGPEVSLERNYFQGPPDYMAFTVIQRGFLLYEMVHWQRVAPPNNSIMSLSKVPVCITKPSKMPVNCRAKSLHALLQRHCMSWVTWILSAEVILSEVRGHDLPFQTFSKFNAAVETALDFRSDITCGRQKLGAQKSQSTCISWCLTSGENTVHVSFLFSPHRPH